MEEIGKPWSEIGRAIEMNHLPTVLSPLPEVSGPAHMQIFFATLPKSKRKLWQAQKRARLNYHCPAFGREGNTA